MSVSVGVYDRGNGHDTFCKNALQLFICEKVPGTENVRIGVASLSRAAPLVLCCFVAVVHMLCETGTVT